MRLVLLVAALLGQSGDVDPAETLQTLREQGEDILEKTGSGEITTSEARRKVQLLLKELETWAETHDVELETRTRTYTAQAREDEAFVTADSCPLFFEEELDELCPLDLAHSEVWGLEVVYCRYSCAS